LDQRLSVGNGSRLKKNRRRLQRPKFRRRPFLYMHCLRARLFFFFFFFFFWDTWGGVWGGSEASLYAVFPQIFSMVHYRLPDIVSPQKSKTRRAIPPLLLFPKLSPHAPLLACKDPFFLWYFSTTSPLIDDTSFDGWPFFCLGGPIGDFCWATDSMFSPLE